MARLVPSGLQAVAVVEAEADIAVDVAVWQVRDATLLGQAAPAALLHEVVAVLLELEAGRAAVGRVL